MVTQIIEDFQKAGKPLSHADRILHDIDSAAQSAGLRKGLCIPMAGGGSMQGNITQYNLSLSSDRTLENCETVKAIVDILSSLNVIMTVEIVT